MRLIKSKNIPLNNREIGQLAEDKACEFLVKKGFTIIQRNYQYKKAELDIIAWHEETLVFVEVKYRSYTYFGEPEISINEKKMKLLIHAGAAFAEEIGHDWAVRFDIISMSGPIDRAKIQHYPDAFFPKI